VNATKHTEDLTTDIYCIPGYKEARYVAKWSLTCGSAVEHIKSYSMNYYNEI
jgi:hypothetical protein